MRARVRVRVRGWVVGGVRDPSWQTRSIKRTLASNGRQSRPRVMNLGVGLGIGRWDWALGLGVGVGVGVRLGVGVGVGHAPLRGEEANVDARSLEVRGEAWQVRARQLAQLLKARLLRPRLRLRLRVRVASSRCGVRCGCPDGDLTRRAPCDQPGEDTRSPERIPGARRGDPEPGGETRSLSRLACRSGSPSLKRARRLASNMSWTSSQKAASSRQYMSSAPAMKFIAWQ